MLDDAISGFGTLGAEAGSVGEGTDVNGSSSSGSGSKSYNLSTIQKSMQQMAEDMMALMMVAGAPKLQPPIEGTGVAGVSATAAALLSVQQQKNEIINKMLEKWNENVHEIAEQANRDAIRRETIDVDKPGPKSSVEYFAYLMSISSTRRVEELAGGAAANPFANLYAQWMNPPPSGVPAEGRYPDPSFVAGCLACSIGAISTAIGAQSNTLGIQLSVGPVADSINALGPSSGLPVDTQGAVAMMAALLYNGGMYRALVETVPSVASPGKIEPTLSFAMNFAQQIMSITTKSLSNAEPSPQNNLLRLMLGSIALNLLYRQAVGGMTGIDMAYLLNGGKINNPEISPDVIAMIGRLVAMIQGYLPKDPASRAQMIAMLGEHVDSKESADSMLETTNLFAAMLNTKGIDASRLNSSTG